jgi:tetratricopeptide (TPR) repeat protein
LVLLALLAGIVGTTLGLFEAWRQEKEARKQEQIAREETAEKEKARLGEIEQRNLALGRADELRHRLGVSDMVLAGAAYGNHDVVLAAERLEKVPAEQRGWEWRYLKQQTQGGLFTLRGHKDQVLGVAFSSDGLRLVSAGDDGTVKVWETATGQELLTLGAEQSASNFLGWAVFSPDGRQIASIGVRMRGEKASIRLWEATPPSPELRVRREATMLVNELFSRLAVQEDVRDHLRRDPLLSQTLRAEALAFAARFPLDAARPNAASWQVVRQEGLSASSYERALRQAREACRLVPNNGTYLNTLGVALYRAGEYAEAVSTLTRSDKLNRESRKGPIPEDLCFLARAHHKLGQEIPARSNLAELRALLKEPKWATNQEARAFLQSAEAEIGEAPTKPNP